MRRKDLAVLVVTNAAMTTNLGKGLATILAILALAAANIVPALVP